ncbi:hypothetical protein [Sphingobacterium sp. IITKGP-BTPF85]|uniref:hypothetical protein n=1 Tax=Sphingobacterium sp. IITKGP-BTPF85 TaxID=1338009 RepID=UPI00041906AB|nr:hypothetical protein [Sphingobacterium sp. IITKGP-BTPF85]
MRLNFLYRIPTDFLEDFFLAKAVDIVIDSIMYSINNPEPGWNSTNYGHYGGARP